MNQLEFKGCIVLRGAALNKWAGLINWRHEIALLPRCYYSYLCLRIFIVEVVPRPPFFQGGRSVKGVTFTPLECVGVGEGGVLLRIGQVCFTGRFRGPAGVRKWRMRQGRAVRSGSRAYQSTLSCPGENGHPTCDTFVTLILPSETQRVTHLWH
jgi:hypothetical protein